MQNGDKGSQRISPTSGGQMLITLESHSIF